jgi:hypothetical protein
MTLPDISRWDHDDDPITRDQVRVLYELLNGEVSEQALEGFLIVASRLVDEFGGHRTTELSTIFRTHTLKGQKVLHQSLEFVRQWVGGYERYCQRYPVSIIPPRPAFPLFKIIGVAALAPFVYRVLDSNALAYPSQESVKDYICRTGKLPAVPVQTRPVRRSKPRFHWCSYDSWGDPSSTREALQIRVEWSDCRLRARLPTRTITRSAYVAFNGDRQDPQNKNLRFYKYFYEPLAQDHEPLSGGGPQIAVEGGPKVDLLEEWEEERSRWFISWKRSAQVSDFESQWQ